MIAQFDMYSIDMVKIIFVFIAIQYFIFLFTIKDKSVRLLERRRTCAHLPIPVV